MRNYVNDQKSPPFKRGRGCSPGFTLIELLVVIAVIGLMVGILLPAVQQAREAARRATCQNNLKQIGLALHNHHDVYQRFPSQFHNDIESSATVSFNNSRGNWINQLMPYLEQPNAQGTDRLPVLLCPSHPFSSQKAKYGDAGLTFYVSVWESNEAIEQQLTYTATGFNVRWPKDTSLIAYPSHGTFTVTFFPSFSAKMTSGPGRKAGDVTDGLSNTIAVGERGVSPDLATGHWSASGYHSGSPIRATKNIFPYQEGFSGTIPCITPMGPGPASLTDFCKTNTLNSFHSGGGHFLFGDGHVRFMAYPSGVGNALHADGNKTIFQAMVSRASGEVTPQF